ncbi:MAG: hypothetical protein PHE21_04270 [Candidatus Dojkabacteria bacterium]|nr:hypothetical protein [Candidatus Dojkabacteria bacterium]
MWRYWGWGFNTQKTEVVQTTEECPECTCECEVKSQEVVIAEIESGQDISCVKRMDWGAKSNFFTVTWDSETRVWIIKNGGTCNGPYCYDYSECEDPEGTIRLQPFWTGHEKSPVNGQVFDICYNFQGACSR